jgi:hypothetical protein
VKFPKFAGEAKRGRSEEVGKPRPYFWIPTTKSGVVDR